MRAIRRAWRFWLGEPLTWIFFAFAFPKQLEEILSPQELAFEPEQLFSAEGSTETGMVFETKRQRHVLARLILPALLAGYLLALLCQLLLLLLKRDAESILNLSINAGLAVASGVVIGLLFALVFKLRAGLVSYILSLLSFSLAVGMANGQNNHDTLIGLIEFMLILGLSGAFVYGLAANPADGEISFQRSPLLIRLSGMACMLLLLLLFGLVAILNARGILHSPELQAVTTPASALVLLSTCICSLLLGFLRLPFYLVSAPSTIQAYRHSRKQREQVFEHLHRSALYWDEHTSLPLPFLKDLLLLAYDISPEKALTEIAFITAQRPRQMGVARAALLEIALSDLETRITLEQIAEARRQLDTLFSADIKLTAPNLARVLSNLNDVSRDATRVLSPIGLPGKRKALDDLFTNLLKIKPRAAFPGQRLNTRLARVVNIWHAVGKLEQERLSRQAQEVGNLDNPYKPGQVLSPRDSLFVGRHHLAQELEGALGMSGRCPAFLLNSERRMGKTSALQQLPYLLGSSYISVFYNLQQPSIYAGTATFLGFLADGITREMKARALKIGSLSYSALRLQPGDAYMYRAFENWLDHIEEALRQEDRMLLLTFDEFEDLEEIERASYMDVQQLLNWMRSIIQFRSRVVLLFSGVKTFTEMGQEGKLDWAGSFINVQMLRISFLKADEARQLILHPTAEYPGPAIFPLPVVEAIISETGCHPFLLQATCSTLITLLNVQRQETATLEDVEQAIDRVLEEWHAHFAHLWQRTSPEQRACLYTLLNHAQASDEQIAALSQLNERIARRALRHLYRRDLILRNPNGTYSIAVPMFQRWLEHHG